MTRTSLPTTRHPSYQPVLTRTGRRIHQVIRLPRNTSRGRSAEGRLRKQSLTAVPWLLAGSGHGLHDHPEQEKLRSRCRRRRSAVTTTVLSTECTVTHRSFAHHEERIRWPGQSCQRIPSSRPSAHANGWRTCRFLLLCTAHGFSPSKHGLCPRGIRWRSPDAAGACPTGKSRN